MSNVIRAVPLEFPLYIRGLSLVVMRLLKKLHSDFLVISKMKLIFKVRAFCILFLKVIVAGPRSACVGLLMRWCDYMLYIFP